MSMKMDDFFDKCKLCKQYKNCIFADTPMSCALDIIARDGLSAVEKNQEENKHK